METKQQEFYAEINTGNLSRIKDLVNHGVDPTANYNYAIQYSAKHGHLNHQIFGLPSNPRDLYKSLNLLCSQ